MPFDFHAHYRRQQEIIARETERRNQPPDEDPDLTDEQLRELAAEARWDATRNGDFD